MLELNGVHKLYGRKVGLSIDRLTIEEGEVVGVLGANGSGKTTMLKAIAGLGELAEGEIKLGGRRVVDQYENIAFITEEGSSFSFMTPSEFATFLGEYFPRFDRARFEQLLDFFELDPYTRIRRMSKGERSKVEICAGFSKGATLILMDEPFLGKDMFARKDFLKLMIASLKGGETLLITTHLIDEIEQLIDRAIILKRGAVVANRQMDELRESGEALQALMAELDGYKPERYKAFIP
ncbi:ABC transporter ATP-binding protein [Paenibacillus sp. HB172176]|uniref:ATP-binding cassette domain-containing protein n=1 Tax=Paenibacillus sp. HB172176 TaxID=2493690 RepID=UPI00143BB496|nr:ABC transporter ATP-binding protein [Paenibacillus sp. HB172176]